MAPTARHAGLADRDRRSRPLDHRPAGIRMLAPHAALVGARGLAGPGLRGEPRRVTSRAMSRVALVTGSSGCIGAAIGTRLERDGLEVLGVDLKAARDRDVSADLATPEGNGAAVEAALDRFGRLDVSSPRRLAARCAGGGVPGGPLAFDVRADADQSVPAGQGRVAGVAGPGDGRFIAIASAHAPRRLSVQVRLRVGQARRARPGQDAGARGCRPGISAIAVCPGLREDPAGRGPDRRPGAGTRVSEDRGPRAGDRSPRKRSSG